MKIGFIYEKTEEEVKKDLNKGIEIKTGVEIDSLLDTINLYEINNAGKPENVLALIKQEIMVILGKIALPEGVENEKGKTTV